jgi:hypothetical protein
MVRMNVNERREEAKIEAEENPIWQSNMFGMTEGVKEEQGEINIRIQILI